MPGTIKEYDAIVWTKDPAKAGTRVKIRARDTEEAQRLLKEKFGEEIECSIWNAESESKVR